MVIIRSGMALEGDYNWLVHLHGNQSLWMSQVQCRTQPAICPCMSRSEPLIAPRALLGGLITAPSYARLSEWRGHDYVHACEFMRVRTVYSATLPTLPVVPG